MFFWNKGISAGTSLSSRQWERVLYACIVLALAATVVAGLWRVHETVTALQERIKTLESRAQRHERTMMNVSDTLATLVSLTDTLEARLKATREERNETETELRETKEQVRSQLSTLRSELHQEVRRDTLSEIAQSWKGRIGKVGCAYGKDETVHRQTGSAVALLRDDDLVFITNRHIVKSNKGPLIGCQIVVPEHDKSFTVSAQQVRFHTERDFARIDVPEEPATLVNESAQTNACSAAPDIGERLVILGYPRTGATEGITATDGIVSGFEEGYYVTSAKIEQGNSGGAAVSISRDCFLGVPTLSVVGQVESLARILPIQQ